MLFNDLRRFLRLTCEVSKDLYVSSSRVRLIAIGHGLRSCSSCSLVEHTPYSFWVKLWFDFTVSTQKDVYYWQIVAASHPPKKDTLHVRWKAQRLRSKCVFGTYSKTLLKAKEKDWSSGTFETSSSFWTGKRLSGEKTHSRVTESDST